MENYKQIEGYSNYAVNEQGEIINLTSKRALKPLKNPTTGYETVGLFQDGERKGYYIHHLVAKYFLAPAPAEKMELDHIDSDKSNNSVTNLQWVTRRQNIIKFYDKSKTKSKYYGVTKDKNGKFVAQMKYNRDRAYIGTFDTELEALAAYEAECKRLGVASPNKLNQETN